MSKFFINRPIFAIVISLMISILGLLAMATLPIAKYPQIAPPQISVQATYNGANAEVISQTVAEVIEKQMVGVEHFVNMTSTSNDNGVYSLTVQYELGSDEDMDTVNTQNRVSQVTSALPQEVIDVGVTVKKSSPDMALVFSLNSPNGTYDETFLKNYASQYFMDAIKSVPGVGNVQEFGSDYAMRIWMDPMKMKTLNVTPTDVTSAIQTQNIQAPVGTLGAAPVSSGDQQYQYTLRADGRLQTAEQFAKIIVRKNADGTLVHLGDIAEINLGSKDYSISARQSGANSAGFMVNLTSSANAVQTISGIKEVLANAEKDFPSDMTCTIMVDSTDFVYASIEEVAHTFFEALVLVALIVFLFLQNWRATLIPMIAVPVSLLGTFATFEVLGFTINTLTLFAMVLAIGLLVDDAIVVIEAVEYEIKYNGKSAKEGTEIAMQNVQGPVVGIACVLSAVFIPVAFLSGMIGVLYRQFALTIAVSVMISAFVALTLTPALCASMLKVHKATESSKGLDKFFDRFNEWFDRVINWYGVKLAYLHSRLKLSILFLVVLSAATGLLFRAIPTSFVPAEDNGYFMTSLSLPEATAIGKTEKAMLALGSTIEKFPGVERVLTVSGFNMLAGSQKTNSGIAFVKMKPWSERTTDDLSINTKIMQVFGYGNNVPEATILAFNPPPIPGLGNSSGFTIMIESKGDGTLTDLNDIANKFMAEARKDPAIGSIYTTFSNDTPSYKFNIDREKIEKSGVAVSDVFTTLQAYYGSLQVNDFTIFGKNFKVVVQAKPEYRMSVDDNKYLYVRSESGEMIPVQNFVTPEALGAPPIITRFNNYPAIKVNGAPAAGYSSGEAIAALERAAEATLPEGYGYDWAEQSREEVEAGSQTLIIFALAMLFVFLVLAALYESWKVPFAVLFSVPTGLFGATLIIYLLNETNNIYFQVGILTVIGLAAKNAILIIEYAKIRVDERGMDPVSAAIEAAKIRLRPIIMTSLAFVVGCIPLALATGAGAASRVTMGLTVVGGTTMATILGIFLIPMLFIIIEQFHGIKLKGKTSK